MAHTGRGTYRAWHIHGGKVSLTYESSFVKILICFMANGEMTCYCVNHLCVHDDFSFSLQVQLETSSNQGWRTCFAWHDESLSCCVDNTIWSWTSTTHWFPLAHLVCLRNVLMHLTTHRWARHIAWRSHTLNDIRVSTTRHLWTNYRFCSFFQRLINYLSLYLTVFFYPFSVKDLPLNCIYFSYHTFLMVSKWISKQTYV